MGRAARAMKPVRIYRTGRIAFGRCWIACLPDGGSTSLTCRRRRHHPADFVRMMISGQYFPDIGIHDANECADRVCRCVLIGVLPDVLHSIGPCALPRPAVCDLLCRSGLRILSAVYRHFRARRWPQLLIGFLLGVVAVIVTTLNGLDRVPDVAQEDRANRRLGPAEDRFAGAPAVLSRHLLTGAKLALAYAFIGVIG